MPRPGHRTAPQQCFFFLLLCSAGVCSSLSVPSVVPYTNLSEPTQCQQPPRGVETVSERACRWHDTVATQLTTDSTKTNRMSAVRREAHVGRGRRRMFHDCGAAGASPTDGRPAVTYDDWTRETPNASATQESTRNEPRLDEVRMHAATNLEQLRVRHT